MKERQLNDAALLDKRWYGAVQELALAGQTVETQAEIHGIDIADAVVGDLMTAKNVREFVHWVNGLDRAAVELSGGDIGQLSAHDRDEAFARRIAHHSGRTALQLIGSHSARTAHRARHDRRTRQVRAENVRLFWLEAGDRGL